MKMRESHIMMMQLAENEKQWNECADYIWGKHGGKAPDDWYEKVVASDVDRKKIENNKKSL